MSETLVKTTDSGDPQSFDDMMLAMDVVDTLRHRERVLDKELSAEEREKKLVDRLRVIYKNQGIDVPDRILRDGVKALEEKRFVYEPPKDGFSVKLAKFYINRDRWLKPLGLVMGLAAFGTGIFHFGVTAPREAQVKAEQVELTQTLPTNLAAQRDSALNQAGTDDARAAIETIYQEGLFATQNGDASAGRQAAKRLGNMAELLSRALTLRVVSRPGEMSGVFRLNENNPNIRNYYLIVEAIDSSGDTYPITITSEEDQKTDRVQAWGLRVSEGVFNRVAADKQDDAIIQNATVGEKPKGVLAPQYSIETAGGAILDW